MEFSYEFHLITLDINLIIIIADCVIIPLKFSNRSSQVNASPDILCDKCDISFLKVDNINTRLGGKW